MINTEQCDAYYKCTLEFKGLGVEGGSRIVRLEPGLLTFTAGAPDAFFTAATRRGSSMRNALAVSAGRSPTSIDGIFGMIKQ